MNMNFSNKNTWDFQSNRRLYITGGIALSTVFFYGVKWIYSTFKSEKITPWLEEYIEDMNDQYKDVKSKETFPVNFIALCMNLVNELQTYFYLKENSDLEKERMNNFGNEKAYEELVSESLENHEKYYYTAIKVIKKRTGIDLDMLKEHLQKADQREFKIAMIETKKPFPTEELPFIESSKLKEAYITYSKTFTQHSRIAAEQMIIMQKRPEYQEIAFKTIFQNKYLLKDLIFIKFGIEAKYLNQLVEKHKLLEDSEVAYYYEDVKRTQNININ